VDPFSVFPGRINYTLFLDRYRIAMREQDLAWMEGIVERACRNLFSAVPTLEAAFDLLDADKSGNIDYEGGFSWSSWPSEVQRYYFFSLATRSGSHLCAELERGLAKLDLGLSRSQLYELMSSIDTDKDGRCVPHAAPFAALSAPLCIFHRRNFLQH
jgi:hypothetical protein